MLDIQAVRFFMRRIHIFPVLLIVTMFIVSCAKKEKAKTFPVLTAAQIAQIQAKMKNLPEEPVAKDEVGVIETNFGTIVIQFYPDVAPHTCASFKKLANHGYYDGVLFHRVVPGFVIQGGDILTRDADPSDNGTGGPGYTLPAEFSDLHHVRGTVSMARKANNINSAGSQFFICLADAPNLDYQYTIFGKVIKGMDVVDKIAAVPSPNQHPQEKIVMLKVRVIKKSALK